MLGGVAVVAARHKHHKVGVVRYYLSVHIFLGPLGGGAAHCGVFIADLAAVYIGKSLCEHFGEAVLIGLTVVHA